MKNATRLRDSAHFGGFSGQKLTEKTTGEVVALYILYLLWDESNIKA